jgi:hypothetical protein
VNLARVRWAVRGTLVLGVAASVTANVLHAVDNPISQAIAAWPPLALLITVELIARVPVHRRWLAAARLITTAVIAGIAAWVSYWHMAGVAARYGETGASPYLLPVSVDGLIVVASICLVELSGRPVRVSTPPAQVLTAPDNAPDNSVPASDNRPVNGPAAASGEQAVSSPPAQVISGGEQGDSSGEQAVDTSASGELSTMLRVIDAHNRNPRATHAQLAEEQGVSISTIRRYRPKSTPGQANGHSHRFN